MDPLQHSFFWRPCPDAAEAGLTDRPRGGYRLSLEDPSWNPPTTYSDSASLDPAKDLEGYELYVNESGTFSEAASPMAEVQAVDPGTGQPRTSFDLANLGPFLFPGVTYQVSIRAVAVSGLKSGYSAVAAFSF